MARVVFFGTPELSVPTLEALHDNGHEIVLVVTQADKRRSRGKTVMPSPVKAAALERGLTVTSDVKDVLTIQADIGVLVAFGRLIRPEILDQLTILNLHPSLLPHWRGATPVEAAILAGDAQTGICVMKLDVEMDAGPVYARTQTPIADNETAQQLYKRLFESGNQMLIDLLASELPVPAPQQGEATYCGKLTPEDFRIDWNKSAIEIGRLVRIGRPWTTLRGKRVLVIDAVPSEIADEESESGTISGVNVQTGDGLLELRKVQPEGKQPLDARAWINGLRLQKNEKFGDTQ